MRKIEAEANARWPLQASLIVHRIGSLKPGDNIVLVVTASEHRDAAFDAARFLMDYLKTRAPFWKRESGKGGRRWVEASAGDAAATSRWTQGSTPPSNARCPSSAASANIEIALTPEPRPQGS